LYIEPGSPWENGYCESFNSKLRDEFLNGEIFYSMKELRVLAERWRVQLLRRFDSGATCGSEGASLLVLGRAKFCWGFNLGRSPRGV
jgi:transposase InsO family protein